MIFGNQRTCATLLAILLLSFNFSSAFSEQRTPKQKVAQEIYAEFYSPFCPGRVLQDCPSSSASELKNQILADLEAGVSKETVINNLLSKYGNELSAMPKMQGFSALAWLIPLLFVLIGGAIIALWLRASRPTTAQQLEQSDHKDLDQDH